VGVKAGLLRLFISLTTEPQITPTETDANIAELVKTRKWANAQRDGRPAEYRWRSLFNAAKFD